MASKKTCEMICGCHVADKCIQFCAGHAKVNQMAAALNMPMGEEWCVVMKVAATAEMVMP